jgi:hypothetical protein
VFGFERNWPPSLEISFTMLITVSGCVSTFALTSTNTLQNV